MAPAGVTSWAPAGVAAVVAFHMDPLARLLRESPLAVLDGALATELERRGCDLNDPLWSAKVLLEQPERIAAVHADYFEAGADVAITASYQASVEGFRRRGLTTGQALGLIRRSVTLAREARDRFWERPEHRVGRSRPLVAASVGPYGAYLADGSEYRGDYPLTEDQLAAFHRPRLEALVEAGADLLACETIPCLREAAALVRLLAEYPHIHAWISFSARDGEHLCSGEPLEEAARWLDGRAQVAAVGINCTAPRHMASLIGILRRNCRQPVVVYPNSGEAYDAGTKTWNGAGPAGDFGRWARTWQEAGAQLIGGCCRTTPEDIRAVARLRNAL
jgi:homocysteine S-methyltransferase